MASPSKASQPKTASIRVIEEVTGIHEFTVTKFSLGETTDEANDGFIRSSTFDVGGNVWAIKLIVNIWDWPDGTLSIFLEPVKAFRVKARAVMSVLDHAGNPSQHSFVIGPCIINTGEVHGRASVANPRELEESQCIVEDSLTVRCILTVTTASSIQTKHRSGIVWTPSELHVHLGNLLESSEGTDVTIDVDGETFRAHKVVLAARSPIFKAKLLVPVKDDMAGSIIIKDIKGPVFKTLLKFIYTDCLTEADLQRGSDTKHDSIVFAEHLLSASDRFGLNRLRAICEDYICSCIDTENVASVLLFAKQYKNPGLNEACLEFLARPEVLAAVVTDDSFKPLVQTYPSILTEIPVQTKRKR